MSRAGLVVAGIGLALAMGNNMGGAELIGGRTGGYGGGGRVKAWRRFRPWKTMRSYCKRYSHAFTEYVTIKNQAALANK